MLTPARRTRSWGHHECDCDTEYQKEELRASKHFDVRHPEINVKAKVK